MLTRSLLKQKFGASLATANRQTLLMNNVLSRNFRAAVVFHGNGVYDGTETTEAVALLVGLSRIGATVQVYAPNRPQAHVVNHLLGEEQPVARNVMEESARIARGNVKDMSLLYANDYDALIIPGGFGAAKNLCSFGFEGENMTVHEDVEKVLASHNVEPHITYII